MEDQMRTIVDGARAAFKAGKVKTYEQRCHYLLQIDKFLKEQTDAILAAQKTDLRKSYNEVMTSEISTCRAEVTFYLKNLKSYMKPETVSKPMMFLGDKTYIQAQPYGVVLLIVPWNYPFYLLFTPLIGAIAAGNCVVIKPSEVSVASQKLIHDELNKYLPADCFPVVCGGPSETGAILKQRFDYIFFTGATNIGRIVMRAAAEFITPVTLELGGKSPTFVDASSDMQVVANRIVANKLAFNAGQACISYDYVMCTKETQEKLIEPMRTAVEMFFGKNMQESESYGRIINERHFDRLDRIRRGSKGRLVIDTGVDKSDLYMGLIVFADVDASDTCMQEEIFGPILPMVPVKDLKEAIAMINEREKPLAAYVFSKDSAVIREFEENTTSGAIVVNDSNMNMASVGESGIGAYHGRFTFNTFSHKRAVMHRKQAMEGMNVKMRYPPYTKSKTKRLISILFTTQDSTSSGTYIGITLVIVGMLVAIGAVLYKHQQTVSSV